MPEHETTKRGENGNRIGAESARKPLSAVIASNVTTISELESAADRDRTRGERFAYLALRITGTGRFALVHAIWFSLWIVFNLGVLPMPPIDPYPFPLLIVLVTLEMIFLQIFVLITQNRITRNAERRARLNLQIDLLAEQESTHTLRLLQRIAAKLGVEDADLQVEPELVNPTDIVKVVTSIDESLPST